LEENVTPGFTKEQDSPTFNTRTSNLVSNGINVNLDASKNKVERIPVKN